MKLNSALSYVGHNSRDDRNKLDFYPTPSIATDALLRKQKFIGTIWECACGDGAMSKIMEMNGHNVISTDLVDRGYGESGVDFLLDRRRVPNIVTNPPFNLATEFILHALDLAEDKVAMLSKISFLEGVKRKELLYSTQKLQKVLIFSRRLPFKKKSTDSKSNGLMAFAWFIFDVNYEGEATLDWV